MNALITTTTLALVGLLYATPAMSQPDPFDDYNTGASRKTETKKEAAPVSSQLVLLGQPQLNVKAGRWHVGLDSAFSWTTVSNDVSGGGNATNTNLFLRITPSVGYFVIDKLEVGASLGYLGQSTSRKDGGTANENNGLLMVHSRYYVKLSDRFAAAPSLAIGGYAGSTQQPTTVTVNGSPRNIDEDASTLGFVAALELAAVYQLSTDLLLRAGLAFTAVAGRQSIKSTDETLSVRTMNTGLSLGLVYAW